MPIAEINRIHQAQTDYKERVKHSSSKVRQSWLKVLLAKIQTEERNIERALYHDFHKSSTETAITEYLPVKWELKHLIKSIPRWMKDKSLPRSLKMLNVKAFLHYEPKGNTLIITPWNYPFMLPIVHLAASVAAGNTVMLKLSEHAPHTNRVIRAILTSVFPSEHVAVIDGGVSETTHLLKLPFDHIHFTGSSRVGKIVAEAAAKNLSGITLELGGKSPAIIDKNVHLRRVVKNLIWAKFVNAGQTCIAPDYLLVHRHLRQEIETVFKEEMEHAFGEHPVNSPDFARIINTDQFDVLDQALRDALSSGAHLITGGQVNRSGRYIAPTVLTHIAKSNRLMQDEIFGPILPIVYYGQVQEAIDHVNGAGEPLALYVFSNDSLFCSHILRHTSSGSVGVNDAMIQIMHPNLPLGGVNASGMGQSLGWYGFRNFSHERAVAEAQWRPLSALFWYPYTERTNKVLQWLKRLV